MNEWIAQLGLALLTIVVGVLGFVLRRSLEDGRELRDKVRSLDQELYGAKGDNGLKKAIRDNELEAAYQSTSLHWMANLIMAVADKVGVEIRTDRPKRGDFR